VKSGSGVRHFVEGKQQIARVKRAKGRSVAADESIGGGITLRAPWVRRKVRAKGGMGDGGSSFDYPARANAQKEETKSVVLAFLASVMRRATKGRGVQLPFL